jgi:hypothetical protein
MLSCCGRSVSSLFNRSTFKTGFDSNQNAVTAVPKPKNTNTVVA